MSQCYSNLPHVWDQSFTILQASSSFPSISHSRDGTSSWTDKVLGIIVCKMLIPLIHTKHTLHLLLLYILYFFISVEP